jgi:Winged helix DNA-binding domain
VVDRVLSQRALNRALLARQLLLERSSLSIERAIEQVGGLQTQYAPSGYVGLWSRLAAFARDDLTAALEKRIVVQATLMRVTIHLVSRREFWRYALGVRQARRDLAIGNLPRVSGQTEHDLIAQADRLRSALAEGPRTVKELGELGTGFVGNLGLWIDLVRVPPSGTWERRRADRLALAEDWVGPCDTTEEEGVIHLVRAYLRAFGPSSWRDIGSWGGIPLTVTKEAGANITLVQYRDTDGRPLVDLPDAPLPDPRTPAPVRFLPHWDANLLVHARRTGLLPEVHRSRVFSTRNPFSVGTYLVDGVVAGAWSFKDGRIDLDPYERLSAPDRRAVEDERAALESFHS